MYTTQNSDLVIKLRHEFPDMPLFQFVETIRILVSKPGEPGGLLSISELKSADLKALKSLLFEQNKVAHLLRIKEDELLRVKAKDFTASGLHKRLFINLPSEIDMEHAQAIIIYGFTAPSSSAKFLGGSFLPEEHVRKDVVNKLTDFDPAKFEKALSFLLRQGVICERRKSKSSILSLNSLESGCRVSATGQQIITVVKKFLYESRSGNF